MGLNFVFHYRFENLESFNNFGHKIVPKNPLWNSLLDKPGLQDLCIQGKRNNGYDGHSTINTGISDLIALNRFGARIQFNDHFDFDIKINKEDIDAQPLLEQSLDDYV